MGDPTEKIAELIVRSRTIVVLVGAGLSTESGIPDFRSPGSVWDRYDPQDFYYQRFLESEDSREKYWQMATEMYASMKDAKPNRAHLAIAELERLGKLDCLITQNIDGLHFKAGNSADKVLELHGTAMHVVCLSCHKRYDRDAIQHRIAGGEKAPCCEKCQGTLKPATISFGQAMPLRKTQAAYEHAAACDLFIVIGSSLVVQPAAQMPLIAKQSGAKLVIVNRDETPCDPIADCIVHAQAGPTMSAVMERVMYSPREYLQQIECRGGQSMRRFLRETMCWSAVWLLLVSSGCTSQIQPSREPLKSPGLVQRHCELIGTSRVERVSEHVWVAIGYDLANVILIHTPEGNVIVDPLMSPKRGGSAKRDLLAIAPTGPIKAIIYTHSHIDHIGGASIWMNDNPPIWATHNFVDHFYKQYQVFLPIETIRGRRQFGDHASREDLPCNGIGRRTDIKAAQEGAGIRLPTQTFSGSKVLNVGGVTIELVEAPGETPDQLIVWLPQDRTMIAADDFYWAFPNLYTIRGTSPRPVDDWIRSIDKIRSFKAEHLVPCHTVPVNGERKINTVLTNYRDAIQWVRDETIRGANRGYDLDTIAQNMSLPPHLKGLHYTEELYGQIDWSAKGIYTSNLGWFDGRPDKLYPMNVREASAREITLMGGPEKVMEIADKALREKDCRWAVHLLTKLAVAYETLAATLDNLNGRGYLLEAAYELRHGIEKPAPAKLDESIVANIPLEAIFTIMTTRLVTKKAMDVHETVYFVFPDEKKRFIVTVRRGIAEAVEGDPLPGTPEPVATLTTDALTYRKLAAKVMSPLKALAAGKITIQGSWIGFLTWNSRFGPY